MKLGKIAACCVVVIAMHASSYAMSSASTILTNAFTNASLEVYPLNYMTKDSLDKEVPKVTLLKAKDESAKIVSNGHQSKGISFDVSLSSIVVREKNLSGYNYSLIRTTDGNKIRTGIIADNEIGIGDIHPGTYLLICSGGESNFVNFITKPRS